MMFFSSVEHRTRNGAAGLGSGRDGSSLPLESAESGKTDRCEPVLSSPSVLYLLIVDSAFVHARALAHRLHLQTSFSPLGDGAD